MNGFIFILPGSDIWEACNHMQRRDILRYGGADQVWATCGHYKAVSDEAQLAINRGIDLLIVSGRLELRVRFRNRAQVLQVVSL